MNLDFVLSKYKWYRKRKGGIWYQVIPRPFPYMCLWARTVQNHEHLCQTENYDEEGK